MSGEELLILLAEDDDGHAYLVHRNLEDAGITNAIVHVRNGHEVLNFVHCRGAFAGRVPRGSVLIVLDIRMPLMDGEEVLRHLKDDPRTAQLPVIMLTTTDDPREVQRCYELGCNCYITKPIDYDRFVEAIRRLGLFLTIVQMPQERFDAA